MGSILKVTQLELPEVKLIEVCKSSDERGRNIKIFSSEELKAVGIDFTPVEILSIHSNEHVLRGMHFQKKFVQSRITSCVNGELFVAMVDVKPESKTKGQSCTYVLKQFTQYIYIPAGYALGTYAVKDSDFICMCGDYPFAADYAAGIRWDDPDVGIEWPIEGDNVILSKGDKELPDFKLVMEGI